MKKQTAYCQHCQCNTPVVNSIPPKWWNKNAFWIALIVVFLPIIGLVIIALIALLPSNNFYCEKCGSYVGHKSEIKNRCVYCGAELEPDTTFCSNCGKEFKVLKDSVTCKNCKTENPLTAKFCSKCGEKLPVNKEQNVIIQTEPSKKQNSKLLLVLMVVLVGILSFFLVDWILTWIMKYMF